MRPIHLGLAVLALALSLVLLWLFVASRSVEAAGGIASDRHGGKDPSRADVSDASDGRAATQEFAPSGRVAIVSAAAAAEVAAQARSKRDAPQVHGRVIAPDGEGVPGATVFASTNNNWIQLPLDVEPEGLPKNWIKVLKATSDLEGRFAFDELKPGPLRIAVRAGGFAPKYEEHLDLPDEQEVALADIRLERGVRLAGRVIDRQAHGIEGAALLVALDSGGSNKLVMLPGRGIPVATTAADGAFRIDQLAVGPWKLIVDAPGYAITEEEGRTEHAGEERAALVFQLETGLDITGKVKISDGHLPAVLRISGRPSQEREPGRPLEMAVSSQSNEVRARHAVCDAEGNFALHGLKPGVRYRLTAWQPCDDPSAWKRINGVEAVTAQAGQRGVELVFKPESALICHVIDDQSGEPLAEFTVSAGIDRERVLRDEKNEVVRTFAAGRVRFGELRSQPGGKPASLRISAVGYKDYENKNIRLAPGQELDLGEVRLVRELALFATVVDDVSGTPVANARVMLGTKTQDDFASYLESPPDRDFFGEANVEYARTGADGKARLTSLPGKLATLRASAKGLLMSEPQHVQLDAQTDTLIVLRLKHGGMVLAHVTDGATHPVAGVGIAHRKPGQSDDDNDQEEKQPKSDAQGLVRFEALARGVHSFRVQDTAGVTFDGGGASQPGWVEAVSSHPGADREA